VANSQAYKREMQIAVFWTIFATIAMVAVILVIEMIQFNAASEPAAIRAIKALGYTNIQIVEKQNMNDLGVWHGCDISDDAKFVASATSPSGESMSMYVCVASERASVHF